MIFIFKQPLPFQEHLFSRFNLIDNNLSESFVLSASGECQFPERPILQLSAHSQINLWGYWLVFSDNDSGVEKRFIFKDSLCVEDQARVARTILRVRNSQS